MSRDNSAGRKVVFAYRGAPAAPPARLVARCAALAAAGTDCRALAESELGKVRNAIVVVGAEAAASTLLRARLAGNRIVLEVRDATVGPRFPGGARLVDGAIFRNRRQQRDLDNPRWTSRVIYDEPDPSVRPHEVPPGEFRAACFGSAAGGAHFGELRGVACIDGPLGRHLEGFNCHLSLRSPGVEELYSPSLQIANAAACGALLVTTRYAAAVELLGEEYPFFCAAERTAIESAVRRARSGVGGAEWKAALERLRNVAAQTALAAVVEQHRAHFVAIEEAIRAAQRPPGAAASPPAS